MLKTNSNCFCHCKDTNSKAIHNDGVITEKEQDIVFATAKILIRKQFTTEELEEAIHNILFLPLQRY